MNRARHGCTRPSARYCAPALLLTVCAALLAACAGYPGSPVPGPAAPSTVASREAATRDYLALARGYLAAGDLDSARRHLDNARAFGPEQADAHHIAALIAAAGAEPDAAEAHFQRALQLAPGDAAAHNNFGVLLHSLGRDGEAAQQFRAAAQDASYPGRAWAWENLGRSLLRQQDWQQARQAFAAALAIHDELPVAALELSRLHQRSGNLPAARLSFGDYLRITEKQGLIHGPKALLTGAELAWQAGNREQVEEFGSILVTLYPETAEYRAYRELIDGE